MLVGAGVNMRERFWVKGTAAGRVPFDMNLSRLSISILAPSKAQRYFSLAHKVLSYAATVLRTIEENSLRHL